jgi:uncharacterized delta-60 repeat protein
MTRNVCRDSARGRALRRHRRATFEMLESRELLSAQGIDRTFASIGLVDGPFPASDYANAIVIQPDGKIVAGGGSASATSSGVSTAVNGNYDLMRYNADGSRDATFGGGGVVTTQFAAPGPGVQALALESDGKLLASGSSGLVRYNADGSLDTSFGANGVVGSAGTAWVAIQTNGDIVTAGPQLRRFLPSGAPDASFGVAGVVPGSTVSQFVIAPDGKIIATHGGDVRRYNADGTLDPTFGGGGHVTVPPNLPVQAGRDSVHLAPDGKIVWVGGISQPGSPSPFGAIEVARLNSNGSFDASFGHGGVVNLHVDPNTDPFAALVQADGKIVVAGRSGTLAAGAGVTNFFGAIFTARLNSDGTPDSSWGTDGENKIFLGSSSEAHAVAQQSNGQIVLAGGSSLGWLPPTPGPSNNSFRVVRLVDNFNQSFVQHAYFDPLFREADPAGLAYFTQALTAGTLTRLQAAQMIEASQEYRELVVQQYYREYLGRAADPGGLDYWTNYLGAGGTRAVMQISILGSDEYYQHVGNANDSFIYALFGNVLHRPINTADFNYFNQALAAGVSRTQLAAVVVESPESSQIVVGAMYLLQFLGRPADAEGLADFTAQMTAGRSQDQVAAEIASSREYYSGM